jgi:predicted TIM-barrel fold metal-dependent hydrolase
MTIDSDTAGRPEYVLGRRDAASLDAWHSGQREEPIEPELAIVDAHHHWWARRPYPYRAADFLRDVAGMNLRATVHVECSSGYRPDGPRELRPVGETESVIQEARSASRPDGPAFAAGIVGFADLCMGARVRGVLEAHIAAGEGRFRGVRVRTMREQWLHGSRQPPAELLRQPQFREGFAQLAPLGLTFDAWLYFHQLPELVDLARAFPDTTVVLDHLGGVLGVGPWADQDVFSRWREAMLGLARLPNVCVKVGGLGMPAAGFGFDAHDRPPDSARLCEAWAPYIETTAEAFGVERCMFESNFPIDKQSCAYVTLWNAFKRATRAWSPAERAALFQDTATRVYRLAATTAPISLA